MPRGRGIFVVHELSIARKIIAIVNDEISRLKLNRVEAVNVGVGALTAVNPEALTFSFEALIVDTGLEGARLEINMIPVEGQCRSCRREFTVEKFRFVCPHCGSSDLKVTKGDDLEIDYLIGQ
jgi:hydrogenase nickel incorporation protein HypA/HybF